MNTLALIMFGSAARGTSNTSSDVDLLSIVPEGQPFSRKLGTLEIQVFSAEHLMSIARQGDLFAAHLAYEGKALFDPSHLFPKFRECFTLRRSYEREIEEAFLLLEFLKVHHRLVAQKALAAKRSAWCARTVMISKMAESGRLVFSPEGLAKEFPFTAASSLVALRRNGTGKIRKQDISRFCEHFGRRSSSDKKSANEFISEAQIKGYAVAEQTMVSLLTEQHVSSSTY
jgi:hypothetical protein